MSVAVARAIFFYRRNARDVIIIEHVALAQSLATVDGTLYLLPDIVLCR